MSNPEQTTVAKYHVPQRRAGHGSASSDSGDSSLSLSLGDSAVINGKYNLIALLKIKD